MSGIRDLFSGFRASASGLTAERSRIDVIARNIANSRTTRMPGDGPVTPYRRQVLRFEPIMRRAANGTTINEGVRVAGIEFDNNTPFEEIHDPSHPDSDADGIVRLPNVNAMKEMADLITSVRSYEANLKAQESFVRMAEQALRLAR